MGSLCSRWVMRILGVKPGPEVDGCVLDEILN
jgi:hypothetical protein